MATYIAHHYAEDGILAFSLNPGGIKTELNRHLSWFEKWVGNLMLAEPSNGAITQLFAGTSPTLTKADSGKYFIPWAREELPREGVQDIALADKLWDFLEQDTVGKY